MTPARRGIALLETVVAAGLLLALVALSLQILATSAGLRRAVERRSIAQIEAANVAERIATLPYERITSEQLAEIQPSAAAKQVLPEVELKVTAEPSSAPPQGKRVQVEITWNSSSRVEPPVRLTLWTYATSGGSSP